MSDFKSRMVKKITFSCLIKMKLLEEKVHKEEG